MSYKWCVVPQCTNTSIKNPEKVFVSVPKNVKRRNKWLQLARRDPKSISSLTNAFMCEDHFDMEKDTVNYMKFKMGFSKKIFLTDEAMPKKFHCQEDRKRRLSDPGHSRDLIAKRRRKELIEECEKENYLPSESTESTTVATVSTFEEDINMPQDIMNPDEELSKTQDKGTITDLIFTTEKSVQVNLKANYRSKAVQTKCLTISKDMSTSPWKVTTISRFTSPLKFSECDRQTSSSVIYEKSDSDISSFSSSHSSSKPTSSARVTTDSDLTDANDNEQQLISLKNTLYLIEKKPLMYVGIPKECYFLIEILHKQTNIKMDHILLCLMKIRKNSTFSELEDSLGISLSYASKIFLTNIPILSSFLKPFIVKLNKQLIKRNLPIAFRHNYYNVTCIIDCLEIDIQKPSKALHQALSWSDYKKGNTVKYLISCTPNGLVNFVSQGYGGRTSDVTIVENCDFLNGLEQGSVILADRGFKHLEQLLNKKGINLLRPPSVSAGEKLTKAQVRQTKIIASLRIHVERVIRRVREFYMLKQHSVINSNILRVLDHVIIIACALINLQDSLIK